MAYGKKLTDAEIEQRLTRLRNLERLHARDRQQIAALKAENKQLKQQTAALTDRFEALFQKQQIRIAELEAMVFGKRTSKLPPVTPSSAGSGSSSSASRPAASFRRPMPKAEAVTNTTAHPVTACAICGGLLSRIREHIRYVEDIVLPVLDGGRTKTVIRQFVQSGWCAACRETAYGDNIDLRGQQVVLGNNVRLLSTYCMTILDMSYSQVAGMFRDLYGLAVSEGELAAIAARQAITLLPEREAIARGIRASPGKHLDETSYHIFSQGMGWAWCLGASDTDDVVYEITESRGKHHALALFGATTAGIHIHDCYGAYKQFNALPGQTCWSHYYRVVRDLATLPAEALSGVTTKEHCLQAYDAFSSIYHDLSSYLKEPFDYPMRRQQYIALLSRIDWFCAPNPSDPKKLQDLKIRLQEWRSTLLTCLLHEGIPADNNKAERHLRKLVLKRKKSFGVHSLKTAKALSTLMSVFWTYRNRTMQEPGRLLPALAPLVRG